MRRQTVFACVFLMLLPLLGAAAAPAADDVLKAIPFFGKMQDVLMNAVPRPSTATAPKYNEVSRLFFTAMHSALTKEQDPQTAVAGLESSLKDLLTK